MVTYSTSIFDIVAQVVRTIKLVGTYTTRPDADRFVVTWGRVTTHPLLFFFCSSVGGGGR